MTPDKTWSRDVHRLAWIHVQFGSERTDYYCRAIRRICERLSVSPYVLVVENSLTHRNTCNAIAGTNILREFSGWNEGLAHADRNGRFDWYVFTNDTFAHNRFFWGTLFRGFVNQFNRRRSTTAPLAVGDLLPGTMLARDGVSYYYASTYFFMMNDAALDRLGRDLVSDAPINWVTGAPKTRLTADTCPGWVTDFLVEHLTSQTSAIRWRDAAALTDINASQLRFKAIAVILEHWLSHRMIEAQVEMVPVVDRARRNVWRYLRGLEVTISRRFR